MTDEPTPIEVIPEGEVPPEEVPEAPPEREGEEVEVGDYPEVEDEIRSDEETAEVENREPAEPSPGWVATAEATTEAAEET